MSRFRSIGGRIQKDLYDVLNVPRSATTEEIKISYRKLALRFHPDRHGGDKAKTHEFREVTDAYAILSDEIKRRQYDLRRGLSDGQAVNPNAPPGWYNRNRRTAPPRDYRKVYAPHAPPSGKWSDAEKHYEMHYGKGFQQDVVERAFQRAKKRGDIKGYRSQLGKGFTFDNEEWNRMGQQMTAEEYRKHQQDLDKERKERKWNTNSQEFDGTERTSSDARRDPKDAPKNPYSRAPQGPQTQARFVFTHNDALSDAKERMQRQSTVVNNLRGRREERLEFTRQREAERLEQLSSRDANGRLRYNPVYDGGLDEDEKTKSFCTIM